MRLFSKNFLLHQKSVNFFYFEKEWFLKSQSVSLFTCFSTVSDTLQSFCFYMILGFLTKNPPILFFPNLSVFWRWRFKKFQFIRTFELIRTILRYTEEEGSKSSAPICPSRLFAKCGRNIRNILRFTEEEPYYQKNARACIRTSGEISEPWRNTLGVQKLVCEIFIKTSCQTYVQAALKTLTLSNWIWILGVLYHGYHKVPQVTH